MIRQIIHDGLDGPVIYDSEPDEPHPRVLGDGTQESPWVYRIDTGGLCVTYYVTTSADEGSGASVDDLIDNIDAVLEAYRA